MILARVKVRLSCLRGEVANQSQISVFTALIISIYILYSALPGAISALGETLWIANSLMGRKMSRVAIGALLATFVAFSAHAMNPEIDTDGDGKASLVELQTVFPELAEDLFLEIDTNADGLVDDEEMMIAVETEMIPGIEMDA
ncbi:hypothetical protein SuNHUV7_27200 (plasmid) [Pseudoseohaeicola sp. NH-UV-7]